MPVGNLSLGSSATVYFEEYNPEILRPIERSIGRASLSKAQFKGFDLWHCYEITFLDLNGIPKACCGTIRVDASSPCIIESKSLKLYLLSFTMTKFKDLTEVQDLITSDLERELKSRPEVRLYDLEDCPFKLSDRSYGLLIDSEPLSRISYNYDASLLKNSDDRTVEETLRSNILRTLCPVTSQPDHAEVIIKYRGPKIDHAGLLAYLISLRTHQGFHEQCCELIFSDILQKLTPLDLTVACAFTRRGGIDITPVRSTAGDVCEIARTIRQ